jgi:hypothetical protein
MIRPPVYQGDAGDYGGMPATYYGGPPINERSRGALQADLANAAGFFMNPLGMMANYVLTGQTPAQMFGVGNQREALGLQQSDVMPQGLMPQGGMSGMFGGLRDFLFGPQQQSVPLGDMRAPLSAGGEGMSGAIRGDAESAARSLGLDDVGVANVGNEAMGLFAQGLDPASAVAMALYSAYNLSLDPSQAQMGAPAAQGAAAQFAPQGLSPAVMAQMAADAIAVNPISGGGQIASTPLSGGESMGSYGEGSFTGGGWSPGDVAGAYSDSTGFE